MQYAMNTLLIVLKLRPRGIWILPIWTAAYIPLYSSGHLLLGCFWNLHAATLLLTSRIMNLDSKEKGIKISTVHYYIYTVKTPPTKNTLQKDRQLQEAQIGFPFPFSHWLAECKLKDQKAVMSQMCVKTRVVYEVGKAQACQEKGKKKHYYYHVPGIMSAPIQTTTEVANSKSKRAWTFSWTTLLSKPALCIRKGRKG